MTVDDDRSDGSRPGHPLAGLDGPLVKAAAMILAARHGVSEREALDLLTIVTVEAERSLSDIAQEVILIGLPPTGALALPGRRTRTVPAVPAGGHTAAHDAVERSRNGGPAEPVTARLLDLLVEAHDLQEVLDSVAGLAVELVSRCESASITLIRGAAPYTAAASDGRASQLDQAQYRLGEGPCLHAAQTDEPVQIDDVAGPGVTGAWVRTAHAIGITASLSMPIAAGAGIAASLNLYTGGGTGWSQADLDAAETLATYAGDAIVIASRLTTPAPTDDVVGTP